MAEKEPVASGNDYVLNIKDSFFKTIPKSTLWQKSMDQIFQPISSLNSDNISFNVAATALPKTACAYIGKMVVHMKARLVDEDGNYPEDDSLVLGVDILGCSMFRMVRICVNGVDISPCEDSTFAMKCWLAYSLTSGLGRKDGEAQVYGYYPSRAGTTQVLTTAYSGHYWRRQLWGEIEHSTKPGEPSKFVYYKKDMPIVADLINDWSGQPLPLIPGCNITVSLDLADPKFYILTNQTGATKKYKLEITSAHLSVPIKEMAMTPYLKITQRIKDAGIVYNMKRLEVTKESINIRGTVLSHYQQIKRGNVVPNRVYFILVKQELWHGAYTRNPLDAQPGVVDRNDRGDIVYSSKIVKASLSIDDSYLETEPQEDHDQFMLTTFRRLYRVLGQDGQPGSCSISFADFKDGHFILPYDLTLSKRAYDSSLKHEVRDGMVKLDITFDKAVEHPLYLFIIKEFDAMAKITGNRSVVYNPVT